MRYYSITNKIFVLFAKIFLNILIINNLTPRIPVNCGFAALCIIDIAEQTISITHFSAGK
jgi:hypothetical protein